MTLGERAYWKIKSNLMLTKWEKYSLKYTYMNLIVWRSYTIIRNAQKYMCNFGNVILLCLEYLFSLYRFFPAYRTLKTLFFLQIQEAISVFWLPLLLLGSCQLNCQSFESHLSLYPVASVIFFPLVFYSFILICLGG